MSSLTVLASPCMTSTIFNSETSSNNRRDDSFSSYLDLIRESLAKDQTHDSGDDSTPTTMRISIGKTQGEDGELGIFRAEKYFSGVMDGDHSTNYVEKTSPVISSYKKEGKMMMSLKSISMTESTCSSETSSANSRINTLLIRDHRRKLSSSSSSGRRRWLLRVFRCSCSGKDATRVDEDVNIIGNKKQEHFVERSSFATKIEDGLTFMTLNSQMGSGEKGVTVSTLRKSLTLLTPPPPLMTTRQQEEEEDDDDDDDLLSETCSSDLFEIDSLSINGGNPLMFRPESGYEPSEASIDWSVTTASGAGNEERVRLDDIGGTTTKITRPSKSSSKHSMLLGCASEKAVNVTTENYSKKPPERLMSSLSNTYHNDQQMRFESLPPLLRYHARHS